MTQRPDQQSALRLSLAPRRETVDLVYRTFGDLMIPLEALRERYFRNLNKENFGKALKEGRIALPVTTLDDSAKAPQYVEAHQLAAYIEQRAYLADEDLVRRTQPQQEHTPHE